MNSMHDALRVDAEAFLMVSAGDGSVYVYDLDATARYQIQDNFLRVWDSSHTYLIGIERVIMLKLSNERR